MYELCTLLAQKKTIKARVKRRPTIKVGAAVEVFGRQCIVSRRDVRFPNAWYVSQDSVELPRSFSRDMLVVR